jgi:hypothetical protein
MYSRGKRCRYCLAQAFLGIGFGKGLPHRCGRIRSEIGGDQHAIPHQVLDGIQYAAFCFRDSHFRLVGGKGLRLGRDLIRLTEESVCRLNCERSIVDVA